jgi:hypothetical protein
MLMMMLYHVDDVFVSLMLMMLLYQPHVVDDGVPASGW